MKKIVFTFGRMNPPTVGHQKLVDVVLAQAKKENADSAVYLSHTQNNKKDPLSYSDKVKYAQKAFGRIVKRSKSKTIIQIAQELEKGGYTDIILVVGSDRVLEFDTLLQKYNGRDYNFDSIEVRTAGQRDPDATGVEGMSASKLRALALDGDLKTFTTGLPKRIQRDAKAIFDIINDTIVEGVVDEAVLTLQQRKKRALMMKKLAPKMARARARNMKKTASADKLQKRAVKAAKDLLRKKALGGQKVYADLKTSEKIALDKRLEKKQAAVKKIAKKLLPKIKKQEIERVKQARAPQAKTESFDNIFEEAFGKSQLLGFKDLIERQVPEDPDIKDKEGSQPRKYHTGLKKGTKEKRDAAFKSGAKKDSGDPSAYPKSHPGDSKAKTKPSKYTIAYKKRFGEHIDEESIYAIVKRKLDQISHPKKYEKLVKLYVDQLAKEPRRSKGNIAFDVTRKYTMNTTARDLMDYVNGLVKKGKLPKEMMASYNVTENWDWTLSESAEKALKKKAEKSGISYGILKKVYDRGMAAWRTGHRPGATQQQWAYARVNSFITGGKTRTTADADLWKQHKGKGESIDFTAFDPFTEEKMITEAVSPAQQAAIAIAKKESGKYDKDGKKKKTEDEFKPHFMYNPKTGEKEWAKKPEDHERLDKMGWVHEPPKKTLNDSGGAGEEGTDKLRKKYEKDTPKTKFKELRK